MDHGSAVAVTYPSTPFQLPLTFVAPGGRTARNLFRAEDFAVQRAFFAARPNLQPTPLQLFPAQAKRLGLGQLSIKDETRRFGLNAFKAVGATLRLPRSRPVA